MVVPTIQTVLEILDRSGNLTVSCIKLRVPFVAVRVSPCRRYPNSSDVFIYLREVIN